MNGTVKTIKEIPEMFKYSEVITPDDCIHRISPSQIDKFFSYPKLYYEENILGKKSEFQGNTATVIGSINHWIFKCVTEGKEVTREIINKQLDEYNEMNPELNLDLVEITNVYPQTSNVVVNEYLIPSNNKGGLIKCEQQILVKLNDNVYLGGHYDRLEGDCVVDFKIVATKPNEDKIPFSYKIQLLAYAYALRMKGHEINRIRIVYGVKPTKTIPARCIVVTESIDFTSEKLISDTLKLINESVVICHNKPELVHIVFKSMDLKQ